MKRSSQSGQENIDIDTIFGIWYPYITEKAFIKYAILSTFEARNKAKDYSINILNFTTMLLMSKGKRRTFFSASFTNRRRHTKK